MFVQGVRTILSTEDKKLLNRLQKSFPVEVNPYAVIGAELAMGEQEVLNRVARLKQEGFIRRLGPVFDSAKLGYISRLVALSIPPEQIDKAAEVINSYTGVTHNYVRTGKYNVWFTFIAPNEERLEKALSDIRERTGPQDILILPATRLFKVNVNLPMLEDPE